VERVLRRVKIVVNSRSSKKANGRKNGSFEGLGSLSNRFKFWKRHFSASVSISLFLSILLVFTPLVRKGLISNCSRHAGSNLVRAAQCGGTYTMLKINPAKSPSVPCQCDHNDGELVVAAGPEIEFLTIVMFLGYRHQSPPGQEGYSHRPKSEDPYLLLLRLWPIDTCHKVELCSFYTAVPFPCAPHRLQL
jgi:hypothetical protein